MEFALSHCHFIGSGADQGGHMQPDILVFQGVAAILTVSFPSFGVYLVGLTKTHGVVKSSDTDTGDIHSVQYTDALRSLFR